MISILENNKNKIAKLCKEFKVTVLYVFGSATNTSFYTETSDIDLAVLFNPSIPVEEMADYYFGLIEALEKLLQKPIDIVTLKSVKNQVFKAELEKTMVELYAA